MFSFIEIPFVKKSSDISVLGSREKAELVPAIEVKGMGTHGIAYCTPSIHKNGERYQIIGTTATNPEKLSEDSAHQMMQHIDAICTKHGLQYLINDSGSGNSLIPIHNLFKDEFVVFKDHNRHLQLLRVMESLIKRNAGIVTLDEIQDLAHKWNDKHCSPPLDNKEFEKQWNDATKFIRRMNASAEEEEQGAEQSSEAATPPAPAPELSEDLIKEISWDEIANVLSTSIKKDRAPKLITFSGMLLTQTNEDQINVGFQAESSTGKSYIPLEVSLYFPKNEVYEIAPASPTAFYHDAGTWDAERKAMICDLEGKILIFMDMQGFQLLEKLRPFLSHDRKELHYKITDKSQKSGLKTKNVIIKGFSSVFFCSAKTDPDEQEKTRLLLLSPALDQDKLKEALELASLRKGNSEEYDRRILQDPQRRWLSNRIYAIRQGGIREVILPQDGKSVCDRFLNEHPYLVPRHQRDLPRIFSFIKAHALLNCFKRDKIKEAKPETIMATQADIDAGFSLYRRLSTRTNLPITLRLQNLRRSHKTTIRQCPRSK